jgi:hypothetical protein
MEITLGISPAGAFFAGLLNTWESKQFMQSGFHLKDKRHEMNVLLSTNVNRREMCSLLLLLSRNK